MKAKMLGMVFMFVAALGLISGCHFTTLDNYRGYGYGSHRDGYRDGRNYETRRDDWRYSRDNYRRR